jgi:hypothetical protein
MLENITKSQMGNVIKLFQTTQLQNPKDLELIFKIGKCNHKTLSPIQS